METMKMRAYIKQFLKHRYLMQLVATCIVFLLIPCVLALYITMYHSYHKLQTESQDFYLTSAKNYFDCFLDEINNMILLSTQISSDSRIPDRPAYSLTPDLLNSNSYYFSEAAQGITFYQDNVSSALACVYYPEEDWLITDSFKYTARSYVTDRLLITDPELAAEICTFLKNDDGKKINMYSLYPHTEDSSGFLLMTVSSHMGHTRTPVLFVYRLDESYLQTSLLESAMSTGLQFAIF